MATERHLTRWNKEDAGRTGYWGPSTSSIDWCEANYEHTQYIAECFNTVSNVAFVALACYGIFRAIEQKLPRRFAAGHAAVALIGVGSALFHMTLQYSWQLGDELPMIYASAFITWIVFDTKPINSPLNLAIPFGLLAFNIFFTVAYLTFPNPVYHEVTYGFLVVATTARGAYLLFTRLQDHPLNREVRRLQFWGSASFLLAFAIWNWDNLACNRFVTPWKAAIGAPWSWVLEGHAWWHIFTGLGCYSVIVAMCALTLAIRDSPDHFELRYTLRFIAWVSRTPEGWQALEDAKPSERRPLLN
ncbi:ceramidase [Leucosporidium creatinivorum]|uniref:Ceramidase n=1 Tax=Leucosporidium creatinivorum TaxID=106004 RepID=A0A1Y2EQK1_9BASI|nr:ceramidase [Leucosporidium creatinivorum]